MTLHRALFSLDDTTDVEKIARKMVDNDWEIIASKETVEVLKAHNIPVIPIEDFIEDYKDYGFPPTLHPKIEAALTKDVDYKIDLVYVIPYGPDKGDDVGGRTLLQLAQKGKRIFLSSVDAMKRFTYSRKLAWGENPYQQAELSVLNMSDPLAIHSFEQIAGDVPEYTNMADLDSILTTLCLLWEGLKHFGYGEIGVAAKHGNACGVAFEDDEWCATGNALIGNKRAIWGGEYITNGFVGKREAELLSSNDVMLDVIAAPHFTDEAIEILSKRKQRKVFVNPALSTPTIDKSIHPRFVRGGLLSQSPADYVLESDNIDLLIAWAVAYSSFHGGNEIAIAKDGMLLGVGGGPSTIDAANTAVQRAKEQGHDLQGASFCADAFFPFTDAPQVLIDAGCTHGAVPLGGKRENDIRNLFLNTGVQMTWIPEQYRGFCRH